MDKPDMYTEIYSKIGRKDEWYTFYQTRDWYDMPDSISENDRIYGDITAPQRFKYREIMGRRFYILPKDVEHIYDCSPDEARSLLNDIREVLALSVSCPVTYSDLQEYTELDMQTIHDFIMES